ncbi:hypothetical protein Tsubulata_026366 [Turnera subulata]|uniref:DYW domain-containing protein n=1 Tax=Turnera subulata TaxID=218843 RepID=A0A9Q0FVB0_9ROSI|nr:hypothetical protein Tsubulata_026366 [Turnera subulata]
MDKVATFHYHHHPPTQLNPLTLKQKPKTDVLHSFSLPPTLASTQTATSSASPSSTQPINLPSLHNLDGLQEELNRVDSVKAMHAQMIKTRKKPRSDSVAATLVTSYLEVGDYRSAAKLFLVGYTRNYTVWKYFLEEFTGSGGDPSEIIEVFKELHCKGVMFDSRVITIVLKICTSTMAAWLGLEIHGSLVKRGFELDVHLKCALMHFYERCWGVEIANRVFHEMLYKDDLLWNEAIVINLRHGRLDSALQLFSEMQLSSAKASESTIVKILQACGKERALNEGEQIHGYVLKHSLASNLSICNCLIIMYSRNDKIELARSVFDSMKEHSLSSWNSIISSYASLGYLDAARDLFNRMETSEVKQDITIWNCLLSGHALHGPLKEVLKILRSLLSAGLRPNSLSITSVLHAVIELGFLNFGKEIHGYVIRNGLDSDVYVGTSLLDMYVKNDCLNTAQAIFDNMKNRNIFAWNCLIAGYSSKCLFDDARRLLNRMHEEGIRPDTYTWNGLVSGYSKCGNNRDAMAVIYDMKRLGLTPNVVTWTALISGCSQNGNFRESFEFFIQMQQAGGAHEDDGEVYFELYQLISEIKKIGYVPDISCVYQNIDEAEKEKVLLCHTEKLAITYGLIRTGSSAPIRVFKNSRICSDCHTAAKFITLVRNREIVLQNGVRFHHFKAGKCSCNDYW